MKIKFTKMHGCGNDYVYINGFTEKIPQEQKPDFVRYVSDRHFGIGSDGAIFINPAKEADFEMEMYNADGSRSEMCGNGMRCVGKYVYDYGLTDKTEFSVVSAGKIKYLTLTIEDGKAVQIRVNMGEPILAPAEIPVIANSTPVMNEPITVLDKEYEMTCVSMGNPHAVVFVEDTASFPVNEIGPYFENHEKFPNRTNTEFVQVVDRNHINMRVYERGTGETLACGTGCCASVVACILNGLTDDTVYVNVLGGTVLVEWNRTENLVYMTGPAVTVFDGEIVI
ncbi:MAG: diaminopimelate epimerase [Lachnospiraceae bacterium]|nr:diaminopimelate epimerase [Lachnospiraceae bacterium]